MCRPAISAARPCSQTAAQAASKAGMPCASRPRQIPPSTSPAPAVASHGGAFSLMAQRPSGAAMTVSGPFRMTTAPLVAAAAEQGAPDAPVTTGLQAGESTTTEAVISNTMPHAMIVTVRYEGGGDTELGIVPAGGEQAFTVAASAGETITLVAADEADTHSRETTITLAGQPEAWTIE